MIDLRHISLSGLPTATFLFKPPVLRPTGPSIASSAQTLTAQAWEHDSEHKSYVSHLSLRLVGSIIPKNAFISLYCTNFESAPRQNLPQPLTNPTATTIEP